MIEGLAGSKVIDNSVYIYNCMIEFNNFMSFNIQYLLLYTFSKETVLIRITLYDKTVFFGETNFSILVSWFSASVGEQCVNLL